MKFDINKCWASVVNALAFAAVLIPELSAQWPAVKWLGVAGLIATSAYKAVLYAIAHQNDKG